MHRLAWSLVIVTLLAGLGIRAVGAHGPERILPALWLLADQEQQREIVTLASADLSNPPSGPVTITLERYRLPPAADISLDSRDSVALYVLDEGSVTVVVDGSARLARAEGEGRRGEEARLPSGDEIEMKSRDQVVVWQDTSFTLRNQASRGAVVLSLTITPVNNQVPSLPPLPPDLGSELPPALPDFPEPPGGNPFGTVLAQGHLQAMQLDRANIELYRVTFPAEDDFRLKGESGPVALNIEAGSARVTTLSGEAWLWFPASGPQQVTEDEGTGAGPTPPPPPGIEDLEDVDDSAPPPNPPGAYPTGPDMWAELDAGSGVVLDTAASAQVTISGSEPLTALLVVVSGE